jgi:hypothetical protein
MRLPIFLVSIFVVNLSIAQTGPGGIESTNGASNLLLWLSTSDLQENGFVDGENINAWADLSGRNSDATISGNPDYINNVINGLPAVRFSSLNAEYLEGILSSNASAPVTIIAVGIFSGNPQNPGSGQYIIGLGGNGTSQASISREGNPSNSYYSFDGAARSLGSVVTSQWHSFLSTHNTVAPYHSVYIDNILQLINNDYPGPFAATNTNFSLGRNSSGNAITHLDGDLAEIIVINRILNSAERNIISNYLAAKFNLTTAPDLYAFDNNVAGNFDFQVAGIGRESDGAHTAASSAGIALAENSGLGVGDYFMLGHRAHLNSVNVSNVGEPGATLEGRWSRVWAVDVTDLDASTTVDVTFDFSDSGLSGTPASAGNYRLIRSDGNDWAIVSSAATISGDAVTFMAIQLTDGNYTLASTNLAASPLSNLTVSIQNGPAGIGSTDGSDGLLLWLDASAITGSSNNDNIPVWQDLVVNDNSPIQATTGLQPHYLTNQQNGLPVIRFDGADDFLVGNFGNLDAPMTVMAVARFNSANQGVSDNDYVFDLGQGSPLFDNPGARASISRRMNNDNPAKTNRFYTFAGDAFQYGPVITGQMFHAFTSVYQTARPFHQLYFDGTLAIAASGNTPLNSNGIFHLGRLIDQPLDFYLNGDIAEMIVYNTVLNSAQITVLQNSLAAKWDLVLLTDFYAGDTPANSDHDLAVSGVGRAIDGDLSEGRSAGMNLTLSADAALNSFILFGHNLIDNSVSISDLVATNGTVTQRIARTWYISPTGSVGAASTIQFDYSEMGIAGSPNGNASDFGLLYRAGTTGSWTIIATASSLSGDQAIFSNVNLATSGEGFYTLGSLNGVALPVTLLSFDAFVIHESERYSAVQLIWSTSIEESNQSFAIERSSDGIDWKSLITLPAKKNLLPKNDYTYRDRQPLAGKSYYKLRQTDLDGSTRQVGNVITVFVDKEKLDIAVYPNPATNDFRISGNSPIDEGSEFFIADVSGRKIVEGRIFDDSPISTRELPGGIYTLTIRLPSGDNTTARFVVRK